MNQQQGRIVRLKEHNRKPVEFFLDGVRFSALEGDTVLTAVLTVASWLRTSDSGPEHRSGFCLMGACQDCWIWQEDGERLQACSTMVTDHMRLLSATPEAWP